MAFVEFAAPPNVGGLQLLNRQGFTSVGGTGLEPFDVSANTISRLRQSNESAAAKCAALSDELSQLVSQWDGLDREVQGEILR
ncbi:MAG: hypothetical protein O3C60_18440, partial [Planctomycetota bacterium]|nr:hypothetical protein [Planctomycetota bacterium]